MHIHCVYFLNKYEKFYSSDNLISTIQKNDRIMDLHFD